MPHPDAMQGLAEKLAAADLNDDEASLLTALLRGEAGDDVEGFAGQRQSDVAGIKLGEKTDPRDPKYWIDVSSLQWFKS